MDNKTLIYNYYAKGKKFYTLLRQKISNPLLENYNLKRGKTEMRQEKTKKATG